jgi:hypothetical protein
VHVDQSYAGADAVLRWNLPAAEADQLLASGTRFEIVNLWRPIRTVTRDPLAVAASWSVPEEDLVPAPIVYPNRRGETWAVKHGVGHKWFYKKGQTPEEVWLIKCFDSWTNVARRTPHSAFDDPDGFGEARESVEVRALVLHDDP